MLLLVFHLDRHRYGIDVRQVVELLPLVQAQRLPQTPPWLAGLIDFHGRPLPLIDLSALILSRPARRSLSTRIVLVRRQQDSDELVGLIAEGATRTLRCDPAEFGDGGLRNEAAPYLGAVLTDADGVLQRLEPERLPLPSMLPLPRAALTEA